MLLYQSIVKKAGDDWKSKKTFSCTQEETEYGEKKESKEAEQDVEDRSEFRLSSAYENPTENPDLELRVTMLNVNDGHSSDLMEHCRTLKEYAQYVARVRKYVAKQDVSLEDAVTRAVDECIEEGILAEFLLKNKTEVIKVSIYEYDKEFEEKKLRKAEYEAGRQDGIEIGKQIFLGKLVKKKLEKGKSIEQIADELEEDINVIQKTAEELMKRNEKDILK